MKQVLLFLDANVLFSAAYRESSGLLKLWHIKRVRLISSAYAVEEARRNLDHDHQRVRLEELLIKVKVVSESKHKELPDHISLREKDRPILLAAITAKAEYLITGDFKDFGKFYGKKVEGVTILPPSEYLKIHIES